MIFITGDTHGTKDISKLPFYFAERDDVSKEDYLIICGDVAVCGSGGPDESEARKILRELPVTVLFCDGNHENFLYLDDYPEEYWNGGKVHFIEEDIIHLTRGQIFEIDNKTFLVCGGAFSADYMDRVDGMDWFSDREMPSEEEYRELWRNVDKAGYEVDYIITHTGPEEILDELGFPGYDEQAKQSRVFQDIAERVDFKAWFFGHLHVDESVEDTYFCLFNDIICLEETE